RIIAEYPGGDHAIFLGQVEAMGTDGEVTFASEAGERYSTLTEYLPKDSDEADPLEAKRSRMPLAYYRGQYRHLSKDYQRPSLAAYYDEDFE
ncbi:MAG TPA: flavin reductase family protein, partial [Ktedonobacteraceae bacterium]|nr:flavin reductase family protein [Ktedonobacteraceae bacterium]